jgi:long-chain fatty acid transport protein
MKLIPAVVMGMCSSYAVASGFALLEQNASGLGNGYAGQAATAENASTIFANPAGMTQLKDREISLGVAAIAPSFKFTDGGSSVGFLGGKGTGGDAGRTGYVPNVFMSWNINKDLYIGAGLSAPFGLKTEYDTPWLGAAQSTSFSIDTYNFNPSIGYRLNDAVSIGGGVNWMQMNVTYKRVASVAAPSLAAAPVVATLSGSAWGWNAGALFTVSSTTKLGVSYRSTVQQELSGDINVGAPASAQSGNATASVKLPDSLIFSATNQVTDKWQLLGDLAWTGWSSIPKLDLNNTTLGTVAQTLNTDFRDTWRIAFGANYRYSPDMKLKFGIAFDQTPVKGPSTRLTSLPDNDRTQLSAGTQFLLSNGSTLDLGISYLMISDSQINNNQTTATVANRGTVTGNYTGNAVILGVQYSMPF